MSRSEYESMKRDLQVELLKAQDWIRSAGHKLVLVFEGRDAAGKGGTIKRILEHLDPRGAEVVALSVPSEREQGEWFFHRYGSRRLGANRSPDPLIVGTPDTLPDHCETLLLVVSDTTSNTPRSEPVRPAARRRLR